MIRGFARSDNPRKVRPMINFPIERVVPGPWNWFCHGHARLDKYFQAAWASSLLKPGMSSVKQIVDQSNVARRYILGKAIVHNLEKLESRIGRKPLHI